MNTAVDVVTCSGCDSPVLPSSTVCGECGERLAPPTVDPRTLPTAHGPDCPCLPCTLFVYDNGLPL